MSDIYLIRHGQASFAGDNYDCLSDLGRRQSEILGQYFSRMGQRFDALYCGTIERQKDTASAMAAAMPSGYVPEVKLLPELNEYESNPVIQTHLPRVLEENPDLEEHLDRMKTNRRSFQLIFEKIMLRWVSGDHDEPGVPRWSDYTRTVRSGIKTIMQECGRGKTVAVVSSGGPICATMQAALHLTDVMAIRVNWMIRNASVSVFKYNSSGIALSAFNSVAHLEECGDPGLITYR